MNFIRPRCESRSCRRFIAAMPGKPTGPRRRYCSDRCQKDEKNARQRARHRRAPIPATGKRQSKPFRAGVPLGTTFGELTLLAYVEPVRSSRQALFLCRCGGARVLHIKNVKAGLSKHCGERSKHLDPRVTDSPAYRTAHTRWEKVYGKARVRPCLVCGRVTEGNQIAYLHSAADERADVTGKEAGKAFSADLADYGVLCKSHHSRFDRKHAATFTKGTLSLAHVALAGIASQVYEPALMPLPVPCAERAT